MIRSPKWNQARCENCNSWHFTIQLDENMNPIEYKCCRCGRLEKAKVYVPVLTMKKEVTE